MTETQLHIPGEVQHKAIMEVYGALVGGEYPEDEWRQLTPEWDLNLWQDDGEMLAAIYAVEGNRTNTQIFVRIFQLPIQEA